MTRNYIPYGKIHIYIYRDAYYSFQASCLVHLLFSVLCNMLSCEFFLISNCGLYVRVYFWFIIWINGSIPVPALYLIFVPGPDLR